MVTLSICCVTFNHSSFIEKCIESLLNQETNFEFEILIFDDASIDNNQELINRIASKNKLIKLFFQNENQWSKGNFGMLTHLFPAAKGKYIAFCEGDDYWDDPHKLQKQVDFLEAHPDYVLSFHEVEKIDYSGKLLNQYVLGKDRWKDLGREQLISGKLVPTVSAVIRGSYIKNLPPFPKSLVNGDTFLFAFLGQFGIAHFHWDIQPAKYRIHGGGVWSEVNPKNKIESQVYTFEMLCKAVLPENRKIVVESLFEKYLTQFTRYDYSKNDKVKMYLNLWKFSSKNQLLGKMISAHFQTLKIN